MNLNFASLSSLLEPAPAATGSIAGDGGDKYHAKFSMKTNSDIFAIHFPVIAFELFYPQWACLSEKPAAGHWKPKVTNFLRKA